MAGCATCVAAVGGRNVPKIVGASRKLDAPSAEDGVDPEISGGSEGKLGTETTPAAASGELEGTVLGAEFPYGFGSDLPEKGGADGVEGSARVTYLFEGVQRSLW